MLTLTELAQAVSVICQCGHPKYQHGHSHGVCTEQILINGIVAPCDCTHFEEEVCAARRGGWTP